MKRYAVFAIAATVGIVLTGCSTNEAASVPTAPSSDTQSIYVMQEGDTQITGEVTEIIGNEVTLALGNVSQSNPQREIPDNEEISGGEVIPQIGNGEDFPQRENGEGFPQRENGEGFPQRENGEGFPGRDFGEGFQRGNGEGFPQREGGDGFPQQRGNGEGFPQMGGGRSRGSSATIEKNGETSSYIIPVGMTVIGASGRNNDYSAVSAGMILRLTINANGYVVAAEIL